MQYELAIMVHDLKVILLSIVENGISITTKTRNGTQWDGCVVVQYDSELDIVFLSRENDDFEYEISIYSIESIEFESFHPYRGESGKVFVVN